MIKTFLIVLAFAFGVVAFAIAGLGIKMFFIKGAEFKRHCDSVDPKTGERIGCTCGHNSVLDNCKHGKKYHPLEINKELMEECGTIPTKK